MPTLTRCGCRGRLPAKRFLDTAEGEALVCEACYLKGTAQHGTYLHPWKRRIWSGADTLKLLTWYQEGFTQAQIAAKLGCSRTYLKPKWAELGLCGPRQALYTANQVATDFFQGHVGGGVVVLRWIREGCLCAQRHTDAGRPWYWIRHDDLLAFLELDHKCMAWQPEDIADNDVRIWATKLRAAVPWRWLTLEESGAQLACCARSVLHYIEKEILPGVKEGRRWWVRSDHVAYLAQHPHLLPDAGARPGPRRDALLAEVRASLAHLPLIKPQEVNR